MHKVSKRYKKDEVMALLDPLIAKWFEGKFKDFTEPQSYAVPLIHDRKNVLVSSPTGSGKTLTAFTSIINELFKYSKEGRLEDRVYAVYISPLKALANDINRNLEEPLREMAEVAEREGESFPSIRVGVRTGDTSQAERQKMLRKPPHILITTPESLALVLAAPKFREKLAQVEYVILDEIHEVCDSKRGVFLSLTLERLQELCSRPFVRVGLSATLAPIQDVAEYLVGYENGGPRDVNVVEIMRQRDLDVRVECPTDDMTALPYEIVNSKMYDQLYEMIQEHRTTIVFTNTRSGTEHVVFKLKERGLEGIEAHHGSLAKETRLDVEERLKKGQLKCVVSSTSLELGIDIGSVDLVVQIGSPKSVAKGLQRIGRSGHGHGLTSKGRMLVFEKDDLVECAVLCRAAHRKHIDRVSISENCLDVLSQSLVGMSLEQRWDVQDALRVVRRSYCYRNLPEKQFQEVLRYLGSKDAFEGVYPKLWYDEEEGRFGKRAGSRMIYFLNLGTIPEEANYKVFTDKGGLIGDLSEKFVERLSARDVFVLGGKSYEYVRAKGMKVFVKEAAGRKPTVPSWSGEMLPRSFDLSMNIATFRRELRERLDNDEDETLTWMCAFGIDHGSARSILSYFKEQRAACDFIPDDKELAVEGYIDMTGNYNLIFHFPFGRRVNDALSRGYAFILTQHLGSNVSVSITDDTFMVSSPKRIEIQGVERFLTSEMLEDVLMRAIKDSELFKQRFRHTASRSFMILRNYKGREVSVGRQQVRSSYLLEALGEMEGVPVIDETYREIMEDVMDIKNAREVLRSIESGAVKVRPLEYTSTPSPFAHNAILAGISDMVLMEDRGALLRELHRRVLSKVMGSDISEFEFTEDQVVPYFRQRIGFVASKADLLGLVRRAGPIRVLKEKGRSVYPFTVASRESVDAWSAELVREGAIASVYIDDAYFVPAEDLPTYLSVLAKDRRMGELETRMLPELAEARTPQELAARLDVPGDKVHQALRKLEAAGTVGRVDHRDGKWFYRSREVEPRPRQDALDEVLMHHLECFAPATAEETAYALGLDVQEVRQAFDDLVQEGLVARGRYLVSEHEQYMLRRDHLRLKTHDLNAYDHRTVESYRRSKQDRAFASVDEMFDTFGDVGMPLDAFHRVENFRLQDWEDMRRDGRLLLGRFMRGRVRYVRATDAPAYVAAYRNGPLRPLDQRVLDVIRGSEDGLSLRQLIAALGLTKDEVKESVDRLDRNMYVVRRFEDREEWSSGNVYLPYDAPEHRGNARKEIVERFVRANGPVSIYSVTSATQFPIAEVAGMLQDLDVETITVGESREEMYLFRDELEALKDVPRAEQGARIVSLYDPSVQSMWAAIAARYGDRWIFPIVHDGRLVGGAEKWNMSGCIEVRELDLEDPALLPQALDALDRFMEFYVMMGYDIVRLREVLGSTPENLPAEHAEVLASHGYHRMGDMYVKGNMLLDHHPREDALAYVLWKQRIDPKRRYPNVVEAIRSVGGLRSDAAAALRCKNRIPLKKMHEMGFLVRVQAIPDYVTYCSTEFASLCRRAKDERVTDEMRMVMRTIAESKPMSRNQLFDRSVMGHRATYDALKALNDATITYLDQNKRVCLVPESKLSVGDARKEVVRHCFRNFGLFTAENLSRYIRYGMPMKELRIILAELEEEGLLSKGFLIDGDENVYWALREEVDRIGKVRTSEKFVLGPEDGLHTYLAEWIRQNLGGTYHSLIMDGPRVIGSFRGRVKAGDIVLQEFKGDREAREVLNRYVRSMGLTLRMEDSTATVPDWEVQAFYEKTHPGEV
ncbi:MAG: ATP-dependent helicase [Methanomassiliicoccus sp.]|nr:ATP-dependent helicase [Methanomassiliicoccus sp.]